MSLPSELVHDVLARFRVDQTQPTIGMLQELIDAYITTVPWESASRIARSREFETPETRVRFAETFWRDALERGLGGTCFESNGAFAALLRSVGFDVTYTINDIKDCRLGHTALVVHLDGRRLLVDMGYPAYTAVPIDEAGPSRATSVFHQYTLHPVGGQRYRLERDRHPEPVCYTLIDRLVDDDDYDRATLTDHGPEGLFLDSIVINKIVGGVQWRYSGRESPDTAESFPEGRKTPHSLGADPPATLSDLFGIDLRVLRMAFERHVDAKGRPPASE